MSDYLKKIKSIFIVEDEPAEARATEAPKPDSKPEVEKPVAQSVPEVAEGKLSDKFVEILSAALEQNNQQGFDYLEYRQALKNLANMPMDEPTRFKSAYAMAQTMGVTASALIESAKAYFTVLQNEQTRFNEAHAQQRSRLIGNREGEINQLEQQIRQKTEQIAQLTREIEEHKQRGEAIRKEIAESTVKIETTRADFEATYEAVAGRIREDIGKMQQFLQG